MRQTSLIFFLLFCLATIARGQSASPNVLFIAVDDLNTCPEGFEGETTVHTPNITRLANLGVRFTNAHCAAPACNPSRASVMTGLAPATTGVYLNSQDWRVNRVLEDWITLPQHFQNNGYKTLGGGKLYHAASLSNGMYEGYLDPRPWDEYYPSKSRQMPEEVDPPRVPMNSNPAFYRGHFDWAELDIDTEEMADAKVVSWAEEQLSREHDEPLFLAVGIYRPHIPWWTPREYFERHPIDDVVLPKIVENDLADVPEIGVKMRKRGWHQWLVENGKWKDAVRGYNASVSFTDDMVGRLLDALEKGPMADNTIIVFWTDHGYHLGQKENWEKFALWDITTRVPMILAAPGMPNKGAACRQPTSLLDIFPTLNELCGLPYSGDLDGESLALLIENPAKETGRAAITTHGYKNHAVCTTDWRYIRYEDGTEELYDQVNDRENFHNLANLSKYDSVKRRLAEFLPERNAEGHPNFNGQAAMNEKYEARQKQK